MLAFPFGVGALEVFDAVRGNSRGLGGRNLGPLVAGNPVDPLPSLGSAGLQTGCRAGVPARTYGFGVEFAVMAEPNAKPQPATAAVVQGAVQPRFGEVRIRQRGRIPHWEKDTGLYFITFHPADSLPQPVLKKIAERQRILIAAKRTGAQLLPSQEVVVAEFSPAKLEEYFDRGAGACSLRDPRIGELMANALRFWEGKRYRLVAWCVMPNRVHVVCRLLPGQELSVVLQGRKSFTARKANEILGRNGAFWQREYYDRLIRNGGELERAVHYVVSNPERARLKGWKWVWSAGVNARATAGLETGATNSEAGTA